MKGIFKKYNYIFLMGKGAKILAPFQKYMRASVRFNDENKRFDVIILICEIFVKSFVTLIIH